MWKLVRLKTIEEMCRDHGLAGDRADPEMIEDMDLYSDTVGINYEMYLNWQQDLLPSTIKILEGYYSDDLNLSIADGDRWQWVTDMFIFEKVQEPDYEIVKKVQQITMNQLGVNCAPINANFMTDLGADSLDVVELVMAAEECFKIDLPDHMVEGVRTVKEASLLIEARLNGTSIKTGPCCVYSGHPLYCKCEEKAS